MHKYGNGTTAIVVGATVIAIAIAFTVVAAFLLLVLLCYYCYFW